MVHDTYMERYQKPSYKFPVVIFITIVAVSVFLSMQIKKTKDNANIEAFNNPVPLDSITLGTAEELTSDSEPQSLNDILNEALVPSLIGVETQIINSLMAHNTILHIENNEVLGTEPQYIETTHQLNNDGTLGGPEKSTSEASAESGYPSVTLDDVYNKQQDNFWKTLAKSAIVEQQVSVSNNENKNESQEKIIDRDNKSAIAKPITTNQTHVVRAGNSTNHAVNNVQSKPEAIVATTAASVGSRQPIVAATTKPIKNVVHTPSESELERFLSKFTYFYNSGDINRLMALFTENASTNDSQGKRNIKADYVDLFNNTHARRLMIKQIKWQVNNNKAIGAAEIIVTVQNKNEQQHSSFKGKLTITTVKQSQGYYISQLLHDLH